MHLLMIRGVLHPLTRLHLLQSRITYTNTTSDAVRKCAVHVLMSVMQLVAIKMLVLSYRGSAVLY
jgi:hypothetical protein